MAGDPRLFFVGKNALPYSISHIFENARILEILSRIAWLETKGADTLLHVHPYRIVFRAGCRPPAGVVRRIMRRRPQIQVPGEFSLRSLWRARHLCRPCAIAISTSARIGEHLLLIDWFGARFDCACEKAARIELTLNLNKLFDSVYVVQVHSTTLAWHLRDPVSPRHNLCRSIAVTTELSNGDRLSLEII